MAIYLDVSAAVHRRAGLGRYADNLAQALTVTHPDRYALFYNRERGIQPLASLAHLPTRTVALGYKPWRMAIWLAQLARVSFDRLVPDVELFHAQPCPGRLVVVPNFDHAELALGAQVEH